MYFRAASVVLLLLSLNFVWGIKPLNYSLAGLIIIWLAVSARGMASMRSQVFGRVHWRGEGTLSLAPPAAPRICSSSAASAAARSPEVGRGLRYAVALTFDDGPSEPSTAQVLDVLKKHGVKATFFVIGRNLKAHPELARRIAHEGHELGNHSYSHPWVFRMLFSRIKEDIELCQDEIEKVAGYRPRFFRQPIGLNNPSVMKVVDKMGMAMVGWQVRAYDAVPTAKEKIVKRILRGVLPGGIILLHDGCDGKTRPDRTATVQALEEIIPELKKRGYEFRTVSGLLGMEPSPSVPPPQVGRD